MEEATVEGPRTKKLRAALNKSIDNTTAVLNDKFLEECFPNVPLEALKLIATNLSTNLRTAIINEYEQICNERKVVQKLNALDELCLDAASTINLSDYNCPEPIEVPELQLLEYRIKIKENKREELSSELSELEEQVKQLEKNVEDKKKQKRKLETLLNEQREQIERAVKSLNAWKESSVAQWTERIEADPTLIKT